MSREQRIAFAKRRLVKSNITAPQTNKHLTTASRRKRRGGVQRRISTLHAQENRLEFELHQVRAKLRLLEERKPQKLPDWSDDLGNETPPGREDIEHVYTRIFAACKEFEERISRQKAAPQNELRHPGHHELEATEPRTANRPDRPPFKSPSA